MSGDMKIKAEFKQLPTSDSHNCFGCSPVNSPATATIVLGAAL
jgi:hypothetical protein